MRFLFLLGLSLGLTGSVLGQCTETNAAGCECLDPDEVDCDLLPDITIEWDYAENYHTEYTPGTYGPEGRVSVSGHTPNIGVGPLNLRGVDEDGYRWMVCNDPVTGAPDTFSVYDPSWSVETYCPDGSDPKHIAWQRIFHKNADGTMSFWEKMANTFVYHPTHGHMHFDDWTILTLRIPDPNIAHPLDWPIVGDGAKLGFCVMDLSDCLSNDCRDDATVHGQGNVLSGSDFPNYGLGGGSYGCSPLSQGISSGYSDIYGEHLDGMWLDIPVGTCNGDYAVVLQCGKGEMLESNPDNNYTWFPITLTQQTPSPAATIAASGSTILCPGETVTLNASSSSSNAAYQWYDASGPIAGANTASLSVDQTGSYSVEVSDASFGNCSNSSSGYIDVEVAPTPVDLSLATSVNAPLFEVESSTGNFIWCNNMNLTLEVANSNTSSANTTYNWSNGTTGSTTTINAVGDYTVVVTDNSFPCPSTISNIISVSSPVSAPVISAPLDTVCSGDAAVLLSNSTTTNWYDGNANLIGTGDNLNTQALSSSETFYAANPVVGGNVGELEHSGTSEYSGSSYNAWISFNALLPLTINTVDVFTDLDGDRMIMLWDEDGNTVDSIQINVVSTNGGDDPTTITLDFDVPVGNDYRIGTDGDLNVLNFGDVNPMFKRQGDQYNGFCFYPYVIDNVIELTNTTYGTDWYYYFYNWDVSPMACESPLVPYEITVINCATELKEERSLAVDVYPNPTTNKLTIEGVSSGTYTLNNVLGEVVGRGILNGVKSIQLGTLPKGVYNITINSDGISQIEKIVLQ